MMAKKTLRALGPPFLEVFGHVDSSGVGAAVHVNQVVAEEEVEMQ